MGWTGVYNYEGYSPREYWKRVFLPEIERWSSTSPNRMKILAENNYGKEFYAAVQDTVENKVWALIVLIVKERNGEISYKDMDETCGPFYNNASVKVLEKLTPTDNEYANEWRKACREEKIRKKEKRELLKKLENGMKVHFEHAYNIFGKPVREFTLVSKSMGYFKDENGTYRLRGWKRNPFKIAE